MRENKIMLFRIKPEKADDPIKLTGEAIDCLNEVVNETGRDASDAASRIIIQAVQNGMIHYL